MNFHHIAVADFVLVAEVYGTQAAVKSRMNKGDTINVNFVGKCCLALHKFSIRALETLPIPNTLLTTGL